jgi:hypothetical protein
MGPDGHRRVDYNPRVGRDVMAGGAPNSGQPRRVRGPEPWGRRLWLTLAAVLVVTASLQLYGIRTWPMADDEVPSLVELGLLKTNAAAVLFVSRRSDLRNSPKPRLSGTRSSARHLPSCRL